MHFPPGYASEDGTTDVPTEHQVLTTWLPHLGVPLEVLQDAARAGAAARDFCTAAHPVWYPALRATGEVAGELRGRLLALRWTLNDSKNIAHIVREDGEVVIVAASGDMNTGLRDSPVHAQTKRRRGRAGVEEIRRNQLVLSPEFEVPGGDEEDAAVAGPLWYFLFHRDRDLVRSELSLADSVSEDGALIGWRVRLVLPEINLLDPPTPDGRHGDGGAPDVDVPVRPIAHG